jgi:hypothetical protein
MKNESPQGFSRPNNIELVSVYIVSELKKVGINLQRIDSGLTITTDKKVPEKVMSNIRQYAVSKGMTIKFLTSV